MSNMLQDKVVAVTGAGRGIGRAIAMLCASQGASVIVNDYGASLAGQGHDQGPGAETVADIKAAGGKAYANLANIAEPEGANSVIEDAVAQFGRIDAVVNNAGVTRDVLFHKMTPEDWNTVINVHLNGSFYVSRAAASYFREQGSGAYVHITSTSGLIGSIGQANYSAAKMGIVGLSNAIALDMRRFGIRSNCLAPFAWSRMTQAIPARNEAEQLRVDRMRSMTAEEVAPMVAFLCADASKDVSGQIFCVRKNEIFIFNALRPIRSVHRATGWTVESIAEELLPAVKPNLQPLILSSELFSWAPI